MTVEIIGDPARLQEPSDGAVVVAVIPDYVPVVQRIKNAVANGNSLQVIVHDRACSVWLERLAQSYNNTVVRYRRVSARDLLAESWQIALPEHITDEAILASGFLEVDLTPRSGQSYEEIVLEYYWGEFFTFNRFPKSLVGDLIENLEPVRWEQNQKLPLAMQALQACRNRWLQNVKDTKTRKLVEAIFDAPKTLKQHVAKYKLVRNYPADLGLVVLGSWYTLFKDLGIDPTFVSLDDQGTADAIQEIQYYLNSLVDRVSSTLDLTAVIDQMSGYLLEEFYWLDKLICSKRKIELTLALVEQIAERFRPIQTLIEGLLLNLKAAVPPAYPTTPSQYHTVAQWLEWAVTDFLPYRFWLEENDRFDEKVASFAAAYADWFYTNYIENRYQAQDRWVSHLLNSALGSVKTGRRVLFIIIDNFNYKYLDRLISLFIQRGFYVAGDVQPVWAMIPTATEVSKWSLIAGEADLQQIQGSNYEAVLAKDWQGHFAGYQVAYVSKIGDLKKRARFSENLIVLNYLPIDVVLHGDEEQIGVTHTDQIQGYLATLVKEVTNFAKRCNVEQHLDIYVASDHGSTKIPSSVDNTLDDDFYRKQAKDKHHRYISVPPEKVQNPTAYDQDNCYIVRADSMGTREDYLIAKRYNRFIRTNESIYVHGGLTPEETIVPFLKLTKAEIKVLQPTVKLPDNLIRLSVKYTLAFTIGNPNEDEIRNVELNVRESDLPGTSVELISAGIQEKILIPVRLRRHPGIDSLDKVTIEGSFEYQGQRHKIRAVRIPVEVRTLMESKTEFDFDL